ncbi:MAG: hypothetical protein RBU37_09205 [Myxococcota bacterium]|jgi:hypothetical protein|nr:hypothetical protein [Myxococcota bacterium]
MHRKLSVVVALLGLSLACEVEEDPYDPETGECLQFGCGLDALVVDARLELDDGTSTQLYRVSEGNLVVTLEHTVDDKLRAQLNSVGTAQKKLALSLDLSDALRDYSPSSIFPTVKGDFGYDCNIDDSFTMTANYVQDQGYHRTGSNYSDDFLRRVTLAGNAYPSLAEGCGQLTFALTLDIEIEAASCCD